MKSLSLAVVVIVASATFAHAQYQHGWKNYEKPQPGYTYGTKETNPYGHGLIPLQGVSLSWLPLAIAPRGGLIFCQPPFHIKTGHFTLLHDPNSFLQKLRFFTAAASVLHGLLFGIDRII